MKRALLALGLWLLSAGASAQQLVRDGNTAIRYAAMSTQDLSPEMARQYGIRQDSTYGYMFRWSGCIDYRAAMQAIAPPA